MRDFDFDIPRPNSTPEADLPVLSKLQAIKVFREATGESIGYSKHLLERNFGDSTAFTLTVLLQLIRAYHQRKAQNQRI